MDSRTLWLAPALLAASVASAGPGIQATVTLKDLGVPSGFTSSIAFAINEAGVAAGHVTSNSGGRAFTYKNNRFTLLPNGGGLFGDALGLNETGTVVGAVRFANESSKPAMWKKGKLTLLALPRGSQFGEARGVNGAGVVVGTVLVGHSTHAAMWQNGKLKDLGTLPGDTLSAANFISAGGEVVGSSSDLFGPDAQPFRWNKGKMTALPLPAGVPFAYPRGVSAKGDVLGESSGPGTSAIILWKKNVPSVLPLPAGFTAAYNSVINGKGEVVALGVASDQSDHLLLWQGSEFVDLGVSPGGQYGFGCQRMNNKRVIAGSFGDEVTTHAGLVQIK